MATALMDGGGQLDAFGTETTCIVDNFRWDDAAGVEGGPNAIAIDKTGATNVARALQGMFDNRPDGTVFVFPVNGKYLVERRGSQATPAILNWIGRNWFQIIGNGSEFITKVTAPYDVVLNDCMVSADGKTLSSATGFAFVKNSSVAWYVLGDGYIAGTRTTAALVSADLKSCTMQNPTTNTGTPGGPYTIRFRSPADRYRPHLMIRHCKHTRVTGLTISGPNFKSVAQGGTGAPGGAQQTFDATLEAQHAISLEGGTDNWIYGNHLRNFWGDGVDMSYDTTAAPAQGGGVADNVRIFDNEIERAGRHGLTGAGLTNVMIERNNIHDGNRHVFDMEPPGNTAHCLNVTFRKNNCARFFVGGGFWAISVGILGGTMRVENITIEDNDFTGELIISIGNSKNGAPRWGPIDIINNRAQKATGTGTLNATDWANIPAIIKAQFTDNMTVTGNTFIVTPDANSQTGYRFGMYGVQTHFCRQIDVHDNDRSNPGTGCYIRDGKTNGGRNLSSASAPFTQAMVGKICESAGNIPVGTTIIAFIDSQNVQLSNVVPVDSGLIVTVDPTILFHHEVFVELDTFGTAHIDGGGVLTAVVVASPSTGRANIDGGGVLLAAGDALPVGTCAMQGGGVLSATGSSLGASLAWDFVGTAGLGSKGASGGSGFGVGPFAHGNFGGT